MNIYPLLRPALFALEPETAHAVTLAFLNYGHQLGLTKLLYPVTDGTPVTVMGLTFKNRLGLAAGLDKNGDYIDALAGLGFGFIEIGTVTPRPQAGNPKPRLFRLPEQQAIINRMGFNNLGVEHLLKQVQLTNYKGILGINIGKNFDTPIENAAQDYLIGLRKSYPHASYITINISSPNTKNLRQLQQAEEMKTLLAALKQEQQELATQYNKYVPLVVKIAPDLATEEMVAIAQLLVEFGIDGVIATNTTLDRSLVSDNVFANEAGGLSGAPLREKATAVVKVLASELNGKLPIIAAGGVFSAADAQEKLAVGASLVQIYSGLIYQGPQLVSDIVLAMS